VSQENLIMSKKEDKFVSTNNNEVNRALLKLAVKNKSIADLLIDYSPRNKAVIEKAKKENK
tara:strand:+ start:105 stop:287 length:183 start_codon:yes stop_codon:yes gene_type:complete